MIISCLLRFSQGFVGAISTAQSLLAWRRPHAYRRWPEACSNGRSRIVTFALVSLSSKGVTLRTRILRLPALDRSLQPLGHVPLLYPIITSIALSQTLHQKDHST
jgi:hypothetical protein